jgi:hypothetical protein
MFDYLCSILLLIGGISYAINSKLKKRNKFKKGVYEISAYYTDSTTKYYIVMESRHGKFIDARKLSKESLLLIPLNIRPLLTTTYNNYESAQKSLQKFKAKIK